MFEHLSTWTPRHGREQYTEKITLHGETIRVCNVSDWRHGRGTDRQKTIAIQYDETGLFYSFEQITNKEGKILAQTVSIIRPDQALRFILSRTLHAGAFTDEILRELEAPQFPFIPSVPRAQKKRRARRKICAKAMPFSAQLEMATGLVEVVRKLEAAPDPAALAEARREVSKLHLSLHDEAAFKAATVA